MEDKKRGEVISLTGAGGKTSLIAALVNVYRANGRRVAVTTTTHMQHPLRMREEGCDPGWVFAEAQDTDTIAKDVPCLITGVTEYRKIKREDGSGCEEEIPWKISSPGGEKIRALKEQFDVVLIEADGSAKFPVKAYRSHEPAADPDSDTTMVILGLSGLGQRIRDVCFAKDKVCEYLDKKEDEHLTEEDYVRLLTCEHGLARDLPGEVTVVLNQADTPARAQAGARIADVLEREYGIQAFLHNADIYRDSGRIAMIFLAAGSSVRFGGNKLLTEYKGKPMACHVLERAADLTETRIVVTQYPELAEHAEKLGYEVVINENPGKGISESMKLGLAAAQGKQKHEGYFFCVCDQPELTAAAMKDMMRMSCAHPDKIIACMTCDGNFANPNIFPERFTEELYRITGDRGGREVIRSHMDDVMGYCISFEEACDIDTRDGDNIK